MASENIWAIAAQESPGATISKLQIERWSSETNESILVLLNAKISTMLEGIADATERQAATQIRAALVEKRRAVAQKHGTVDAKNFRAELVQLAVEAGLVPTEQVSKMGRAVTLLSKLYGIILILTLMQSATYPGSPALEQVKHRGKYLTLVQTVMLIVIVAATSSTISPILV